MNDLKQYNRFLLMKNTDNVAVAMESTSVNAKVLLVDDKNSTVGEMKAVSNITYGNKIAIKNITKGEQIIKYGASIGTATKDIVAGELVHVQNVKSNRIDIPVEIKKEIMRQMDISE